MPDWLINARDLTVALLLVAINGFFVATEFALVKVRGSRLDLLGQEGGMSARVASWLGQRLDGSLSSCQLGITIASLALGAVGEPAFGGLLKPVLKVIGIQSEHTLDTISFAVAFTTITALHLVVGEQAPKIFAIRQPERMLLWCAIPMALFYFLSYPLLVLLSWTTSWLLTLVGAAGEGGHDAPHTEDEIRALVAQAHVHGEVTPNEQKLIDAVFRFDDLICRRVMVPRNNVTFLTLEQTPEEHLAIIRETQHTRYPVCESSLDDVVGVLHIKDLIGRDGADLKQLMRPANRVPETMLVSHLLRHFQATHQLMAMVDDEYGTLVGIVTLENVLEQIVGSVEDEFDSEESPLKQTAAGEYLVMGHAPLALLEERLNLDLPGNGVDSLSGYLTERQGRVLQVGDQLALCDGVPRAMAEVLEMDGTRAVTVRVTVAKDALADEGEHPPADDHAPAN